LIVVITSLIYWKREPIKKWLRGQKVDEVELSAGPLKVKLTGKEKSKIPAPTAGVSFGEGSDFSGATIRDVAGRDIRRGSAAAESSGGKTPGVDFGKKGKFGDAEIEDVAGRDIVED
ncbi:MAG: hypothetical protein SVX38_15615, partial [Chloroflexota bacterium]|nr:hypothetical protein [Chloroflexota bacterium]